MRLKRDVNTDRSNFGEVVGAEGKVYVRVYRAFKWMGCVLE